MTSRTGPMVVARIAAHSAGVPAGAIAAATGRLLAVAASRAPVASWLVRLPWSVRPVSSSARIAEASRNIGIRSDTARAEGPVVTVGAAGVAAVAAHQASGPAVIAATMHHGSHESLT
ncbi:MAG TPA: hypothetical protein VKD66_15265 [Streptosporangiaceae bacterium]|nr:hypothetical protein [Streptosporangiaceae bacterium]